MNIYGNYMFENYYHRCAREEDIFRSSAGYDLRFTCKLRLEQDSFRIKSVIVSQKLNNSKMSSASDFFKVEQILQIIFCRKRLDKRNKYVIVHRNNKKTLTNIGVHNNLHALNNYNRGSSITSYVLPTLLYMHCC